MCIEGYLNFIEREVKLMPSSKVLEEKKLLVETLAAKIQEAKTIVLADYRGLTVEQDTQMREAFRKEGIEYKVYKNTLTKLAAKKNNITGLDVFLEGPTAIAFSNTDPVAPAKLLAEFAKKFNKLELKAGVVEGKVIDEKGVKELASLPSREELVAKMLGSLNAPISGFVNVLNGNLRGLVVALNAIKEQKEKSA
jgi:large subunit ribosomal protein L10